MCQLHRKLPPTPSLPPARTHPHVLWQMPLSLTDDDVASHLTLMVLVDTD